MTFAIKRKHLIGLVFILIVGAALRFIQLDSSEFWYDEASLSTLAQSMAEGKSLPLLGILSSARIPNPPNSVYLLAIPYAISKNPLVAVTFVALLNVIGITLLWLIAQRYFGPLIAFVGGLLYAVSPWAVLYSRKIWEQDMNTPLLLAGFLLALYGFVEGKRWAQVLCLPVLFFAMEVHFAAWALLPAYLWLLWIGRKRVSRRAVAISIVLALLTLVPFVIGLRQADPSSISLASEATAKHGLTAIPLQYALWLATGLGLGQEFVFPPAVELVAQVPALAILCLLLIPLIALGIWTLWRKSRSLTLFLLLIGFVPPISLISGLYSSQPHYFIPCIAIYCLLAGAGIVWLGSQQIGILQLRWAAFAALALIAVVQVADWRSFLTFADANAMSPSVLDTDGYGTPLHYLLDIRSHLGSDVVMIAGSIQQALPVRWQPLLDGQAQCLRELVIADGGIALLPAHPFSLLRAPDATPYEFADMYKSAAQTIFPLRIGEGSYTLDQINTPPVWAGPQLTSIQPAHFDNGVALNGYTFSGGRLYLEWMLPGPSDQDYQYFAHVLNANSDKLAQHDASFWPGKYWCSGDHIVTWYDLPQPADAVTLRIGMYRLDHSAITGDNVIDSAGSESPWVDIPLKSAGA